MNESARRGFNAFQGYISHDVHKCRTIKDYEQYLEGRIAKEIGNLLIDLMHFCDEANVDFSLELGLAQHIYQKDKDKCTK